MEFSVTDYTDSIDDYFEQKFQDIKGVEVTWERPAWYMTTEEFADLIVLALEQTNHFKRGERVHPEDINCCICYCTQKLLALGICGSSREEDVGT
jgi:hypothetical protein